MLQVQRQRIGCRIQMIINACVVSRPELLHCTVYAHVQARPHNALHFHLYMYLLAYSGLHIISPPNQQTYLNPLTPAAIDYVLGEIDFSTECKVQFLLVYETFLQEFTSLDTFYHDFRNHVVVKSMYRI